MNLPDNLRYTKEHEWIRLEGDVAYIGITDFAQHELGDIVYVDIESVGQTINANEVFGTVEAVKTVSDLFLPITGEVLEVSLHSAGRPELLQKFVDALTLEKQPRLSLHALYQGWMDTVIALQTAFVTGLFAVSSSREQAAEHHQALLEVTHLRVEIARFKAAATKEKQIARQVELNLEIKRLEREETKYLGLLRTEGT